MGPDELKQLLSRQPFIPLRLHVAEKVVYDILNPNMAMVGRTVLFLGLARDVDSPFFDDPVLVSLQHITRIEPIIESIPA